MDTRPLPSSDSLDASAPICPRCGYSLQGISSEQCPECGLAIEWDTLSVSQLPWAHRASIGRWKAYWRTNLLAIFRPGKLAAEINRPVSPGDARRFRQFTVLLAWLALAGWSAGAVATRLGMFEGGSSDVRGLGWWLEACTTLAAALAGWLALYLISDAASFFFNPPSLPVARQDRAVGLSYYAQAALAWLWMPSVLALVGVTIESGHYHDGTERFVSLFMSASYCLYGVIFLLCGCGMIVLMRRVTGGQAARTVVMAIYLPIAWFVLFAICGLIPLAVLYVSLIILSFH